MPHDIKSAEDRLGIGFANEVEKYDYAEDSKALRIVEKALFVIMVSVLLAIAIKLS